MTVHAPTVVIYEEANKKKRPLGIRFKIPEVLTDDGFKISKDGDHKIYTPKSRADLWRFAKLHASHCDVQVYQFIHHLGSAHLATEPITVYMHNSLRVYNKSNPNERPHDLCPLFFNPVQGLMGINHLAGLSLIDP